MLEKIRGFIPVNWALAGNPYNWAVIVLMIAIGGIALGLVFHPSNDLAVDVNSADED